MSHYDVTNYLEKIYKVPVTQVVTKIITGDIKKSTRGYLIKDPDYKMAYVSLVRLFTHFVSILKM